MPISMIDLRGNNDDFFSEVFTGNVHGTGEIGIVRKHDGHIELISSRITNQKGRQVDV